MMRAPRSSSPALTRARQWAVTWRVGQKCPLRWTLMTASQSSSSIEKIIRSRRKPALLTRMSTCPQASMACCTISPAAAKSATSLPFTRASPPLLRMRLATSWAGPSSTPLPSPAAPRSLTRTLAPWSARSSACSRPRPRPAPVMMATLPSTRRVGSVMGSSDGWVGDQVCFTSGMSYSADQFVLTMRALLASVIGSLSKASTAWGYFESPCG